jgi:nucleotidyltransferase substrate binding protein (TIGR01987 family)
MIENNMEFDIRWKQRFANFEKALNQLTKFIEKGKLNEFEIQGLIQCFEYTYELAWNTVKDYLEAENYQDVKGPRSAITTAFRIGLIDDGEGWMQILKDRNQTSHTYNEQTTNEISENIYKISYPLFVELGNKFRNML